MTQIRFITIVIACAVLLIGCKKKEKKVIMANDASGQQDGLSNAQNNSTIL